MKLTKMSILAGALMILLIGCSGVSDSSGGDPPVIPTMTDGENVATDQAVNFITSLEDVEGGLDGLSDGQSVTIDGVQGTVTVTEASTPTGTRALVGTDTEPNKTITFTFPDGGKFEGEPEIKLFDDGMSIDGVVNFDVTDVNGESHDVPVHYEEATLNADGEVISGAIQVENKDGVKIELDASDFNTLKKLATFIHKIDEKMIAILKDDPNLTSGTVFPKVSDTSVVYEQSYTATPKTGAKEEYGPYDFEEEESARTKLTEISERFVKKGGSDLQSWSYSSYIEMPLKTLPNQPEGFIMDLTLSLDMLYEYSYVSPDSEEIMSMKFSDTATMDGTIALEDTTVVFNQVTTIQILEEELSPQFLLPQPKNELYRFTGSITIDGVTIELNNGAMEALASLQGDSLRNDVTAEDVQ